MGDCRLCTYNESCKGYHTGVTDTLEGAVDLPEVRTHTTMVAKYTTKIVTVATQGATFWQTITINCSLLHTKYGLAETGG